MILKFSTIILKMKILSKILLLGLLMTLAMTLMPREEAPDFSAQAVLPNLSF